MNIRQPCANSAPFATPQVRRGENVRQNFDRKAFDREGTGRQERPRDVTALATIVQRLGALLAARPEIQEVDLNPVTVYAVGQGALALDALIVMNAPDGRTTS